MITEHKASHGHDNLDETVSCLIDNANFFATEDAPYPGYMFVEIIEDVTPVKVVKIPVWEKP